VAAVRTPAYGPRRFASLDCKMRHFLCVNLIDKYHLRYFTTLLCACLLQLLVQRGHKYGTEGVAAWQATNGSEYSFDAAIYVRLDLTFHKYFPPNFQADKWPNFQAVNMKSTSSRRAAVAYLGFHSQHARFLRMRRQLS